jgi:hypothetical protein
MASINDYWSDGKTPGLLDFGSSIKAGESLQMSGLETVKPGFWSSFGTSTQLMSTGISLVGNYFKGKVAHYNNVAKAEMERTKYWTQLAHTNRTNYRNYEMQLKSWYRASDYTQKMKQYEEDRKKQQADYKGRVSELATENFAKKIADLDGQFYEQEAADELELDAIKLKSVTDSAKKVGVARGDRVGNTIKTMRESYNQQYLQNLSNREITRKWRIADKTRAAESLNVARENTINQVRFYTPQPVADPVKPLAPIKVEGYEPPAVGRQSNLLAISNAVGSLAQSALDYKSSLPDPEKSQE